MDTVARAAAAAAQDDIDDHAGLTTTAHGGIVASTDARTPTTHSHPVGQIGTGTPAAGTYVDGATGAWTAIPSGGSVAWGDVTGKPDEFPPEDHDHAIADVTGLQTALDGKAASSHDHAASAITSGTVDTARLGSGTADSTKFLRGDQTWASPAGGGSVATDAIFDAKGDLPVGTGADTAAKLTVGTNGKTLKAASGETTGLKWETATADLYYTAPAGEYVGMVARDLDYAIPELAASGRLIISPYRVPPVGVDRAWVRTTSAGTATWRLGYYPMLETGLPDWANAVDCGTVDMSGTTGGREATISRTLPGHWVWLAILTDAYTSNPTVYASRGGVAGGYFPGMGQSIGFEGYNARYWSGVSTGAIPTTAPSGNGTTVNVFPTMRFRKA